MDVQIYSFVIPTLISIWGMTRGQAGVIGTAALLVSAVGGWLGGWCADRYGRVRVLQVAILWFAVFTLLSGLAQNFQQLLAARALMGLGFGGEWAAGAVLLGETMRPNIAARPWGSCSRDGRSDGRGRNPVRAAVLDPAAVQRLARAVLRRLHTGAAGVFPAPPGDASRPCICAHAHLPRPGTRLPFSTSFASRPAWWISAPRRCRRSRARTGAWPAAPDPTAAARLRWHTWHSA